MWVKRARGANGADRDRTDNLLDATEALSQLSYGPADTDSVSVGDRGVYLPRNHPSSRPQTRLSVPFTWRGISGYLPLRRPLRMSVLATLFLYCGVILVVSVLGGLVPSWLSLTHRRMQLALCLVSGVMLGVGMLHMLGHAAEAVVHAHGSGPSMHDVMLAAVGGFLAMFLLERFFCFHHHETPDEHGHTCGHDHASSVVCAEDAPLTEHRLGWIGALVGLTVHTLLAGIALGAAVANGEAQVATVGPVPGSTGGTIFELLGFSVFLGIVLHKPFDAFTIVALMQRSGKSRTAMHLVNIVFALMIPLGVIVFRLGADLASNAEIFTIYALAFSGGTFICIAASDVLPELQFHKHDRVAMTAMLVLGLVIAWASGLLEEGGHDHGSHQSDAMVEFQNPAPPAIKTID